MSDSPEVKVLSGATQPESALRPYSIVLIGDFAAPALAGLTPVDKESFAQVMQRARPTLTVAIPAPVGGGPDWEFKLSFENLKALSPHGLLSQISAARSRLTLREKIRDRRDGRIGEEELARTFATAAEMDSSLAWLREAHHEAGGAGAAAADAAPTARGSILDDIDEPSAAARVSGDVERIAREAGSAAGRVSGAEVNRNTAALERVENELAQISLAVLRHPEVRRLEAAWRGLKFLVDRIDFRAGVKLGIVNAPRDAALDRMIECVVNPAFDGDILTPGLILLDYPFGGAQTDLEMLDGIAQHAASLPVPAVFTMDATFFNVKSANLIKNLPNLSGLIDTWQFAKWRGLRDKPYARSLAAVLGRFVLRAPYERGAGAEFSFDERPATISDVLWGGGHLVAGVCAARAFATHGWPTRMYGSEAGKIENLPIVPNPNDPQRPWGPGDAAIPDAKLEEFPAIGLNILQSIRDKDYCYLLGGVSVARPIVSADTGKQQANLQVSLPYQQFANITGAWICEQQGSLQGLPAEEIQRRLILGLRDLMKISADDPDDSVQVGVGALPDDPSRTLVQVKVLPPARIVPGGLELEFGFAVAAA